MTCALKAGSAVGFSNATLNGLKRGLAADFRSLTAFNALLSKLPDSPPQQEEGWMRDQEKAAKPH